MLNGNVVKPSVILFVMWFVLILTACSSIPSENQPCAPCVDLAETFGSSFSDLGLDARRWLFQLQNVDLEEIAASGFDLVVIDYSGDSAKRYTRRQIEQLKNSGKQVLAYLSIGEAEAYRDYFKAVWVDRRTGKPSKRAPCWLCCENSNWPGNYKVQYWSNAWQEIVLTYLDQIIAAGFDGVYLDIIDAYFYWSNNENSAGFTLSSGEAAARMINFVQRIAHHARLDRNQDSFLIVPQNASAIFDFDRGSYLETINGIGIESLYFEITRPVAEVDIEERSGALRIIRDAGKGGLIVDYVDRGKRPVTALVHAFQERALASGFIPYAARADQELNEMNSFEGQP